MRACLRPCSCGRVCVCVRPGGLGSGEWRNSSSSLETNFSARNPSWSLAPESPTCLPASCLALLPHRRCWITFLSRILTSVGRIKPHQNQPAAPGFRRHREKLLEEFVLLLIVVVFLDCISGAPCVGVNGSCSLWGPAMVRGLCSGSPESWAVDLARGLAKVAA